MRRARNIVAVVLVVAGLSFAQDTGSSQQETIRLLVQQVKELQERVKALEAKPASPSTAAGEALAQPQAVEEAGTTPELHEAGLHELRGIQWRGFGEVNYKVLDQRQPELGTFGFTPGSAGNFYTG
ncbi:MAG: hypothetical protein HYR57_06685, partial [Candidatus Koribacter versatilis]|nr:hypothetical protein [Candidatus Koribacter versatilis]